MRKERDDRGYSSTARKKMRETEVSHTCGDMWMNYEVQLDCNGYKAVIK